MMRQRPRTASEGRRLHLASLLANAAQPTPAPGRGPAFFDIGLVGLADALRRVRPAVHLPLGPGLTPAPTIEGVAEYFEAEVRRHQPRGPYLLGGYCFGGLVALETARRLAAAGDEVRWLLMVETPCPTPALTHVHRLRGAALALRKPAELVRFARRRLLGPEDAPSLPSRPGAGPFYQWTSRLLANYSVAPFDLPVTLCFAARSREQFLPRLGWEERSRRGLEVEVVDATHEDIGRAPGLARHVLAQLAVRAGASTPGERAEEW
jgi:thioesterase domain-containing protein